MAVSKRLRYEVLRRDNYRCRYCGLASSESELTVDHVTPTALGGSDQPENLVACCKDCNAGKSASNPDAPLVANVTEDALRWAAAMREAAELQRATRDEISVYCDAFYTIWMAWGVGEGERRQTFEQYLPNDWQRTLEIWHGMQVDHEDLERAVRVSFTKKNLKSEHLWKYTCGVIWRLLDDRQQKAQEILAKESQPQDEPDNELEPYAPDGYFWRDGQLIEETSDEPVRLVDLVMLFDDAYWSAVAAKQLWPDITVDEVMWGYPRYVSKLGDGIAHRLNVVVETYDLSRDKIPVAVEHIKEDIQHGFDAAVAA